ncbi:DUF5008 domain-containing protein [Niabella insulamsoli]|uniref:DUF5008 domain-containing protein n=1 Tax=Niabella insulamsoli TaxID=3144874 RepID=UPI0031FD622E
MIQLNNKIAAYLLLLAVCSGGILSCKKNGVSEDPLYAVSPEGLISFEDVPPSPSVAAEGSVVTIKVNGLKDHEGSFRFYINQTPADIVAVSNEEVRIRIPITASTGSCAIEIDGQFYFGPVIDIRGKLNIDPTFNATTSVSDNSIYGIETRPLGGYLIYGAFRNYENKATALAAITGLAFIDNNGALLTTGSGSGLRPAFNIGTTGLNGTILSAVVTSDNKVIAGGVFSSVNTRGNISNISRFNANGSLDTTAFDIAGDGSLPTAIGPAFNGGFSGAVNKLFNTSNGVVAIGNFFDYNSILYERSTSESPYVDKIRIGQVARVDIDGNIDSSFNLNTSLRPVQGYTTANGYIYDGVEMPGNKLLMVGNFTVFENQSAGRIVRIDLSTGRRDAAFAATGANGSITKITYNSTTKKLLLTGEFTTFNGQPANGIVMLDENGNVDNSFDFKPVEGGIPNFAGQLNDGKIMVSGTFNKYNGIVRPGFMVLNPDGSLAVGYNNIGYFDGVVQDFVEFPSDTDPSINYVILVGSFNRYDSKDVGNIVKVRFQN